MHCLVLIIIYKNRERKMAVNNKVWDREPDCSIEEVKLNGFVWLRVSVYSTLKLHILMGYCIICEQNCLRDGFVCRQARD